MALFVKSSLYNTIFLYFFLSVMVACSSDGSKGHDQALLSISVKSTESVNVATYDQKLLALHQEIPIISNPYVILARLWPEEHAKNSIIKITQNQDVSDLYHAIVIFDSIPDDDSVRGYRFDVRLQMIENKWTLQGVESSWRCWQDRGHSEFSKELCN